MIKISVIGLTAYGTRMKASLPTSGACKAESFKTGPCGGGVLASEAICKLEGSASLLSAVGDDSLAPLCLNELEECGVDHTLVVRPEEPTAFVNEFVGAKCVSVVYPGASLRVLDLQVFDEQIRTSNLMLLFSDIPFEVCDAAMKSARKYGIKTVLALAGAGAPPAGLTADASVVLATDKERAYTTQQYCKNAAVLRDGCGISWRNGGEALFSDVVPGVQGGLFRVYEAFVAGYCVSMASGAASAECALYARACAAFCAGGKGLMFPNKKNAQKAFSEIKL